MLGNTTNSGLNQGDAIKAQTHMQSVNQDLNELTGKMVQAEQRLVGMVERAFGAEPTGKDAGVVAGEPVGAAPAPTQKVHGLHAIAERIHMAINKLENLI